MDLRLDDQTPASWRGMALHNAGAIPVYLFDRGRRSGFNGISSAVRQEFTCPVFVAAVGFRTGYAFHQSMSGRVSRMAICGGLPCAAMSRRPARRLAVTLTHSEAPFRDADTFALGTRKRKPRNSNDKGNCVSVTMCQRHGNGPRNVSASRRGTPERTAGAGVPCGTPASGFTVA